MGTYTEEQVAAALGAEYRRALDAMADPALAHPGWRVVHEARLYSLDRVADALGIDAADAAWRGRQAPPESDGDGRKAQDRRIKALAVAMTALVLLSIAWLAVKMLAA